VVLGAGMSLYRTEETDADFFGIAGGVGKSCLTGKYLYLWSYPVSKSYDLISKGGNVAQRPGRS
jgi:hypothetical protein